MLIQPARRFVALAVLCGAALAACDRTPTGPTRARRPATDAALAGRGASPNQMAHAIHVRIVASPFPPTVNVDAYSLHAIRHGDRTNGQFFFYQTRTIAGTPESEADVVASGHIVCLQVEGNRARVGGVVEHTTFPLGLPVGYQVTWSMTDNGKSAKADDTASEPLGNEPQTWCAASGAAYPEHPVEKGKVQVRG